MLLCPHLQNVTKTLEYQNQIMHNQTQLVQAQQQTLTAIHRWPQNFRNAEP
jgi:hypothetical protein